MEWLVKKKKQFMHDLIIVNHTLSKSTIDNGCVFSEVREDIPISSIIWFKWKESLFSKEGH